MAAPSKRVIAILAVAAALLAAVGVWRRADPQPGGQTAGGGSLVASLRSEPQGYIRYLENTAAIDLVSLLVDGRLVRLNRVTDTIEPSLAESWTPSPDGLTLTFALRKDVRFSDGVPFTSADVEFSARVLYDPSLKSGPGQAVRVADQPLAFRARDPYTVDVTLPSRFAPAIRLLEHVPILPRHKLEEPFDAGRLKETWRVGTAATEIVGLGPFRLLEHTAGQRLIFGRNPHYWRHDDSGVRLPYLDTLTVVILPDQNTEALRLEAGEIDLMSNADIRPEDYASLKRASEAGRLELMDLGAGLDPNLLWFNLASARPDAPWFAERAFRQAVSHAVNRQVLVDSVYLGAAVPIFGPVSPEDRTWYSPAAPQHPYDPARARQLLASAGLEDRTGDGVLDDAQGRPVRFSLLTQAGTVRERVATVVQEHLRQVGLAVDIVTLDTKSVIQRVMTGAYDAAYFGFQASSTDPAMNSQFWLSSGAFHVWNPNQSAPATEWEAQIDELMRRQAVAETPSERQRLFAEVQRIFAEELPAIYFVAPRVIVAISTRVRNARPVRQAPHILWSAETLAVAR